ncbi:hypothetical protein [Oryzomicrobium sp.]|uniref:hypothetical protein n=1 Tax=Oryzomicrobium sp. TaxID=1911578 RepID=UPI002FDFE983
MNPADLPSIARRRPDPAGLDFDGLRQAGIDQLQALCGEVWTDYNLHDPGVTMLEQLCYGLTDVVYRTGFATEDYLFGADGRIDGPRHALLPPEEALPCRPMTPGDYRRLFADQLPEIRNVWVAPSTQPGPPGRLDIHFLLADDVEAGADEAAELMQKAAALYLEHRNLGEDLGTIGLVEQVDYRLVGEIEIDGGRPVAETLADVFLAALAIISPPLATRPYHEAAGEPPELVFEGPLTRHGRIDVPDFRPWSASIVSELVRAVAGVAGVGRVVALDLVDDQGQPYRPVDGDAALRRMPRLRLPAGDDDQRLVLRLAGKMRNVPVAEFRDRLARLAFALDTRRHGCPPYEPESPLPTGVPVEANAYTSVQHHFPPVYGLGDYGVPASASPERKAQARQLQAYLAIFDQVMANFMQGLAGLPDLYSLDEGLGRTYFQQVLGNRDLPGIEPLYKGGRQGVDAALAATLAELDDFGGRRSRSLDVLLALHGEKFTQESLRNFAALAGDALEAALLRDKIAFARQAPELNARRMGAFNYRRPAGPDNVPALAEKVGLLLGLDSHGGTRVSGLLKEQGWRYIADRDFCREAGLEAIPASALGGGDAVPHLPELAELPGGSGDEAPVPPVLCRSLLNGGGDLGNYRIVGDDGDVQLCFALEGAEGGCLLSRHDSRADAARVANRFAQRMAALVHGSIGFHLVEHLLLYPGHPGNGQAVAADRQEFYAFRISAVFPAWSPRLDNPEFRKLVEESFALCCPAHLQVDVLWLDFDQMAIFEGLHGDWLAQKREGDADKAARVLALFLQRCARKSGERGRWI